jgi:hypothetical protein
MKTCNKCKQLKPFSDFHKNTKDKYAIICKLCKKEYDTQHYQTNKNKLLNQSKQWQSNNKQIVLDYQKEWYNKNKDTTLIYHKEYRKNNKNKINKCIKEWKDNKRKNDPLFKIIDNLRSRMYRAIIKNKGTKSKYTLNLIGCSVNNLKIHLEQQFKPEMNWDNYGEIWEVDHIKPCSSFDLTDIEQQKQCFNYINLQPLFKTSDLAESLGYINEIGNRNKSDKIL